MSKNINIDPEELRRRLITYQYARNEIVQQIVKINNLWPRKLLKAKLSNNMEDCEFIYEELPQAFKDAISYFEKMLDTLYEEIVIKGE